MVAVIVLLVAMTGLAAGMLRLGASAQATATRDLLGAQAYQSAGAGLQWGLFRAFKGQWKDCDRQTETIDLGGQGGMLVTVSCDSQVYNEGESTPGVPRQVRIYTLDAIACNGSKQCPQDDAATQPGYVERRRQTQAEE